jgi:hypothetical protein
MILAPLLTQEDPLYIQTIRVKEEAMIIKEVTASHKTEKRAVSQVEVRREIRKKQSE